MKHLLLGIFGWEICPKCKEVSWFHKPIELNIGSRKQCNKCNHIGYYDEFMIKSWRK